MGHGCEGDIVFRNCDCLKECRKGRLTGQCLKKREIASLRGDDTYASMLIAHVSFSLNSVLSAVTQTDIWAAERESFMRSVTLQMYFAGNLCSFGV